MRRLIFFMAACLIPLGAFAQIPDTVAFSLPLRRLKLTSSFGYRINPVIGAWKRHCGIDLSARLDTVFCVMDGVVTQIGYDPALGIFIRVRHGGDIQTTYGHLSIPWVSATDGLSAGQAIGITGATGRVTGEHLHFAVRLNGMPCDPLQFLFTLFHLPGQTN
jgi:murein DD-endopeptidase MepM/ murein hydrolase activator NlpD